MKRIFLILIICFFGLTKGFSQKIPLSYYSPNPQDTASKKYTVALLNTSFFLNFAGDINIGVGPEFTYFDDFNRNFFVSVKTIFGSQNYVRIELGKKLFKPLYFFALWEYNSISQNDHSFSMPKTFGSGLKFHFYKQKNNGKSRAFEFNLVAKTGRGTYSGIDVLRKFEYRSYSSPYDYWGTDVYSTKKVFSTDIPSYFYSFSTDLRVLQMKKISKFGIAYSFVGFGYVIGNYFTNINTTNGSSSYDIYLSGPTFQFGIGLSL